MKRVRYFICRPKMIGNTRIPEIVEYFDLLPINWSAVYYPSAREAKEVCVRVEYDEEVLRKLQEQLDWIRKEDFSNELKTEEDWQKVKDKFKRSMWKDGTDKVL